MSTSSDTDRDSALALADLRARVLARPLPRHVAIIMDGNGRWAAQRGLPRTEGHRAGSESMKAVTRAARRLGVEALTVYAFSSQNWLRPPGEVTALMDLLVEYIQGERAEVLDNGIRLRAIGDLTRLPRQVRTPLEELCLASAGGRGMALTLALSYGGREEILAATRALVESAARGEIRASDIDESRFSRALWTRELPDPDLVIRTSGERRLSNFLLWQIAYAELFITDILWPDFREADLLAAIADFQLRDRRFGKVAAK